MMPCHVNIPSSFGPIGWRCGRPVRLHEPCSVASCRADGHDLPLLAGGGCSGKRNRRYFADGQVQDLTGRFGACSSEIRPSLIGQLQPPAVGQYRSFAHCLFRLAGAACKEPPRRLPVGSRRSAVRVAAFAAACIMPAMNKPYFVRAEWDAEAAVWVATSDDVPGLVTEAETIEALDAKLKSMVPELLEANGCVPADGQVAVELLARRFSVALPATA